MNNNDLDTNKTEKTTANMERNTKGIKVKHLDFQCVNINRYVCFHIFNMFNVIKLSENKYFVL
jgi:hypothetical protein